MRTDRHAFNLDAAAASALARRPGPDRARIEEVLERTRALGGLTVPEAADLLAVEDPEGRAAVLRAASDAARQTFGRHRLLFVPLYLTNRCANDCLYCGFRRGAGADRKWLDGEEVESELEALARIGHTRLLIVAGEDRHAAGIEEIGLTIEAARRRGFVEAAVNVAPLTVEDFRRLFDTGASRYQSFQETYHPETYVRVHVGGPKADYAFRLGTMDRAVEAGFRSLGMGTLLGLHDYRFDVLSLLSHALHLRERWGEGIAVSVSVPRLRPAEGAALTQAPSPVSDDDLLKIVAVYRLALPWSAISISTRELPAMRERLARAGASHFSAGVSTSPGGYARPHPPMDVTQFEIADHRSLREVARDMAGEGWIPNLCRRCDEEEAPHERGECQCAGNPEACLLSVRESAWAMDGAAR
ncbi:MAG: radical SAM protein [Nitrospirae bacterium]|nr:radical SAM protein [Nitrospirota bacterium]